MKSFIVSFRSKIAGSHNHVCVMAKNETEALKKGKHMLNVPRNFLKHQGRYDVHKIIM